jgi:hypothetical protein
LRTGINKLLQRLPDSSREEVRYQAIVLIQQLASKNEEMKKTVVFNEVSIFFHSERSFISYDSSIYRVLISYFESFVKKEDQAKQD